MTAILRDKDLVCFGIPSSQKKTSELDALEFGKKDPPNLVVMEFETSRACYRLLRDPASREPRKLKRICEPNLQEKKKHPGKREQNYNLGYLNDNVPNSVAPYVPQLDTTDFSRDKTLIKARTVSITNHFKRGATPRRPHSALSRR